MANTMNINRVAAGRSVIVTDDSCIMRQFANLRKLLAPSTAPATVVHPRAGSHDVSVARTYNHITG